MTLENPISRNRENLKQISKIHFLVHPGFLSDERERSVTVEEEDKKLFEKYIKQAKTLKDDEIMVAFTHTRRNEFKKDFKKDILYIKNLEKLKKFLGRRLIVLSDDFYIFEGPEAILLIKKLAETRGFTFNQDVLSEAYGEVLGVCVDDAAQNLNETGNLKNKTLIRPELTDSDTPRGIPLSTTRLENYKKGALKKHPRITFE